MENILKFFGALALTAILYYLLVAVFYFICTMNFLGVINESIVPFVIGLIISCLASIIYLDDKTDYFD